MEQKMKGNETGTGGRSVEWVVHGKLFLTCTERKCLPRTSKSLLVSFI